MLFVFKFFDMQKLRNVLDLLEKSRVVSQNKGDRNFHIFYQLLSDAFPDSLRSSLFLNKSATAYKILNQGGDIHDRNIDDVACGQETNVCTHL